MTKTLCLDKGYVELVDHMPHIEPLDLAVVNAARVSYKGESKGEDADKKLLGYLYTNKHFSPWEQVRFQFRVKAPLMVARQWMRYRTGSFNEQSFRYTEVEDDEFYWPKSYEWRTQSTTNKQTSGKRLPSQEGEGLTLKLARMYRNTMKLYNEALKQGVAREQARLFLPAFALYTTFVWNVDARNLMHFIEERADEHAQYEIRVYANAIYEIVFGGDVNKNPLMPWTNAWFMRDV